MRNHPGVLLFTLVLLLMSAVPVAHADDHQFNVLMFTKTVGWHHKSQAAAVAAVQALAERHHFGIEWHEDASRINDAFLEQFDVIVFLLTTGDILDTDQQAAMQRFIRSGKGFVGVHSAADTEHEWQWYRQLVGHHFVIHPPIQTAVLKVEERDFPGLAGMPDAFLWTDEWYEFDEGYTDNLHYLLTVDERSYDPNADWETVSGSGMGEFHPIAWYQEFDGGRSFYTGLGHLSGVFTEDLFLSHLYGGIYWAATGKGLNNK